MEGRLPWRSDIHYHRAEAAYLRELALTATTARVKARLLREAEFHEGKAHGKPAPAITDNQAQGRRPVRF
jgi:hypothetical protein